VNRSEVSFPKRDLRRGLKIGEGGETWVRGGLQEASFRLGGSRAPSHLIGVTGEDAGD